MNKIQKRLSVVFTSFILIFLASSFIVNLALVQAPLDSFLAGETDLSGFAASVQETYKADVKNKNSYVNINGLFARITGRNEYNGVSRLKNGMLTHLTIAEQDMNKYAKGIIEFSAFLEKSGIEYTYIQCPNKTDVNDTLLEVGAVNYANVNADRLAEALSEAGVDMIDFREAIAGTPELVEKYFYKTDHHWNTAAAFYAYNEIVAMLKEKFPDAEFDEEALLESSWEKTVYEDWFLGSHGRRVGKYYGGLDDFVLYTPKFETDMAMSIPKNKLFYKGSFEDVVVRKDFLDQPEYFDESTYCAYIGADYQLIHHINYNAKNDLKVLIIKDSFALAPQAFLSTQVREIDVIDPRYYKEMALAEYVAVTQPDIVITMVHSQSLFTSEISYSNTGVEKGEVHMRQTEEINLGTKESIEVVAPNDKPFKNCIITDYFKDGEGKDAYLLKKNSKYTLTIAGAEVIAGATEGFSVALFEQNSGVVLASYAFDFDNKNENGCYEWSFVTPESGDVRLKVLVYAGFHGSTQGNTLRFDGISLSRWE